VTPVRRAPAVLLVLGLALAMGACGRAQGMSDTRDALAQAGFREVEVSFRTGGGIGVARIQAAAGGPTPEQAAEVCWRMLPVRFDQLVVALGAGSESFGYGDLAARFGPRDPSLDRRQIDEEVVESGLELMIVLSVGALLSVGAVVAAGLLVLRAARRARGGEARRPDDAEDEDDQAEGPISGLGADSPTAGDSASDDPGEVIPS